MKAKNSYSGIVASTAAKGTIGILSVVAVFIVGFVVWSAAGMGNALVEFFQSL